MRVAIIPARGGSKEIPRKNIKLFAGKPLISWTIDIATNCDLIDKVIVSTLGESVVFGPSKALFEGEDFVCVEGFAKRQFNVNDPSYGIMMTALSYQDGKIVLQKTVSSDLDFDPIEGKDWNWEDYE